MTAPTSKTSLLLATLALPVASFVIAISVMTAGAFGMVGSTPRAAASGTLKVAGGLSLNLKLTPADCLSYVSGASADAEDDLYISLNGDYTYAGWSEVTFGITDPLPGKAGAAGVSFTVTGYKTNAGAEDEWEWTTKAKGHVAIPGVSFASAGRAGSVNLTIPLYANDGGAKRPAQVHVSGSWGAASCRAKP
jgi:hypothetical protein